MALPRSSLVGLPPFELLHDLALSTVTAETLLTILEKIPYLKTLIFVGSLWRTDKKVLESPIMPLPLCFSTLEVVEFLCFNGSELNFTFAKFLMDHISNLKRMVFSPNWLLKNSDEWNEVQEQLSTLSNKDAKLHFE
ncbi:hypothetical protein OROGR_013600 [Orobanche gracilis]